MKTYFYDIESLENVFTLANYRAEDDVIEMYYLIDDKSLIPDDFYRLATDRIHQNNKNFKGTVEYYDLDVPENNFRLARIFGLSDARYLNNPNSKSRYPDEFRLVCDTDTDYNENDYPYLLGYNSYNYDTTMLAMLFNDTIKDDKTPTFIPITAAQLRLYNNELFSERFKGNMVDRLRYDYKNNARNGNVAGRASSQDVFGSSDYKNPKALIRKNMMMSGRHLDVARLNEKQSMVGLKRILGMIGCQILESDKLRPGQDNIETADQLIDLFAYNVSDVVNLKKLFNHKTYQSSFILKKQLLKTYPELVYEQAKTGEYKPEISPYTVRNDRLMIDSSSAQMATKSLCPYGHLQDYDTVSFMYPSEAKSKEFNIPRVNVLEETKKFFYKNFAQPELRAKFDEIYNYYKSIEGKNFNSSNNYLLDHDIDPDSFEPELQLPDELKPRKLSEIPSPNTCMFYYNKDGSPSNCFVNFSTGGIHGAEYNKKLYEADLLKYAQQMNDWQAQIDVIDRVRAMYPNPWDIKLNRGVEIDGVKYKPSDFLKPKATETNCSYKDYPKEPKKPEVFKVTPSGSWNVDKRYTYTSAARTNHEDFTSYYPNMLRMMDAFFNAGLGYDRYGEIFDDKTKYGILMKDKSIPQEQRDLYSVMRNGTKLILNSASGAGDANFESNVRMNNKIISMRIIGQLFTWRIGQAQTLEGAQIISTNTDGLYSAGLEDEINNAILAREAADIHVEIEPEPLFLISKDSNNRTEIEIENGQLTSIIGASGGTLSCRKGPNPEKSLAHPAIIDWALCEYLTVAAVHYKNAGIDEPFDDEMGMNILKSARTTFNDDIHTLLMFQNVIASSPGSNRYIFATTHDAPDVAIPLQHYNRCFIMKDGTPDTYHLKAAVAKVVTDAMAKKRKQMNERMQQHDPVATAILSTNGVKIHELPSNKEATVNKLTGIEDSWFMKIDNNDLYEMDAESINAILDGLDYDKYLQLLRDGFENNWRNMTPEWEERIANEKTEAKNKANNLFDDDIKTSDTTPSVSVNAESTANDSTIQTSVVTETNDSSTAEVANETDTASTTDLTDDTNEAPVSVDEALAGVKMIQLDKTLISSMDIYNAEHVLCMNGIREIDAHNVLAKVILALTETNIDE